MGFIEVNFDLLHSGHRDIAYMDVGTYDLSGTKKRGVFPRLWLPASLPFSREHRRSLPSMAPRHTAHPVYRHFFTSCDRDIPYFLYIKRSLRKLNDLLFKSLIA